MIRPRHATRIPPGLAACAAALACNGDPKPAPGPSASAPPSATVAASTAAPSARAPAVADAPPCRALTVANSVKTPGGRLFQRGQPLSGRTWIDIAKRSELTLKDTRSGRELTLVGPGHVLPCYRGEERYLLASGTAVTAPGAGVRPGAQAAIATPFGSFHYGDAKAEIRVDRGSARARVTSGSLRVEPVEGAKPAGEKQIGGPKGAATLRAGAAVIDPKTRVEACEKAAEVAAKRAEGVLSPGADGGLGRRAASQFRARQNARAACGVAAAAAGRLEDPEQRIEVWTRIGRAEARWRTVPKAKK